MCSPSSPSSTSNFVQASPQSLTYGDCSRVIVPEKFVFEPCLSVSSAGRKKSTTAENQVSIDPIQRHAQKGSNLSGQPLVAIKAIQPKRAKVKVRPSNRSIQQKEQIISIVSRVYDDAPVNFWKMCDFYGFEYSTLEKDQQQQEQQQQLVHLEQNQINAPFIQSNLYQNLPGENQVFSNEVPALPQQKLPYSQIKQSQKQRRTALDDLLRLEGCTSSSQPVKKFKAIESNRSQMQHLQSPNNLKRITLNQPPPYLALKMQNSNNRSKNLPVKSSSSPLQGLLQFPFPQTFNPYNPKENSPGEQGEGLEGESEDVTNQTIENIFSQSVEVIKEIFTNPRKPFPSDLEIKVISMNSHLTKTLGFQGKLIYETAQLLLLNKRDQFQRSNNQLIINTHEPNVSHSQLLQQQPSSLSNAPPQTCSSLTHIPKSSTNLNLHSNFPQKAITTTITLLQSSSNSTSTSVGTATTNPSLLNISSGDQQPQSSLLMSNLLSNRASNNDEINNNENNTNPSQPQEQLINEFQSLNLIHLPNPNSSSATNRNGQDDIECLRTTFSLIPLSQQELMQFRFSNFKRKNSSKQESEQISPEVNQLKFGKYHNYNKLFMYTIISMLTHQNLSQLGVPVVIANELISLIGRVKSSAKNNYRIEGKYPFDYFSHAHYSLLFLQLTDENIQVLATHAESVALYKTCFLIDISTPNLSQISITYLNIIKQYLYFIFTECIAEHDLLQLKTETLTEESLKVQYSLKVIKGIKKLQQGIMIKRF